MFELFNFAYLDPGTGSLIVQSLIGAVAGVAIFGRNLVQNIASKFKQSGSKGSASATSEPEAKAE